MSPTRVFISSESPWSTLDIFSALLFTSYSITMDKTIIHIFFAIYSVHQTIHGIHVGLAFKAHWKDTNSIDKIVVLILILMHLRKALTIVDTNHGHNSLRCLVWIGLDWGLSSLIPNCCHQKEEYQLREIPLWRAQHSFHGSWWTRVIATNCHLNM